MKNAVATLRFLLDAGDRGEQTALLTIADVIGSAARAHGTHMAVSETGAFHGSFSGGCVEAAVVGEARRVITAGRTELIRFGAGSRFIDIRLPCGGGLDVLITPGPVPARSHGSPGTASGAPDRDAQARPERAPGAGAARERG